MTVQAYALETRKYIINIPLSPSSKLVHKLKWVSTRSNLFIFINHMREEPKLMPERKNICKLRGWGDTHEYTRCLSINIGAKLHESFI